MMESYLANAVQKTARGLFNGSMIGLNAVIRGRFSNLRYGHCMPYWLNEGPTTLPTNRVSPIAALASFIAA